jgi:hypothetical protein
MTMLTERLNRLLDRAARAECRIAGRTWPAYRLCVAAGIAAGVAWSALLARLAGLSVPFTLALTAGGVLSAAALAMATKVLCGEETFTFYRYQAVVLAATALGARLLGRPVLPQLDVTLLTLGLVQAVGRIGCLMAGCCHGRPHGFGVRYRDEHAAQGFEGHLVGVRLFPVQAVESLCLFAFVAGGTAQLAVGSRPGEALASFAVAYATCRFALERARGDAGRPSLLGLSEAQWTSLLWLAAVTAGELTGALPLRLWHLGSAVAVSLAAIGLALAVRLQPRGAHRLLSAGHVSEIAALLDTLAAAVAEPRASGNLHLASTSLGLRLSSSGGSHYALSSVDGTMTERTARALAALILRLRHPASPSRLLAGRHGVFHLLVDEPQQSRSMPQQP